MNKKVISFKQFSFKYRSQESPSLYDINLAINQGERILITGPSGSGKSTLGRCINGLIPNTFKGEIKGTLERMGGDAGDQRIPALSKKVGTVLQDTDAQFIGLTVGEDIAFALENDAVPQVEMKKTVAQAAKQVGMELFLDQSPHDLSGGQKQRVSMAGVLVDPVSILLFDEPLANLDPASGKATMHLIDRIQKETGVTVVIIEHRVEDVLAIGIDRIVLVADGKIVADAPPDQLLCSGVLEANGVREPLYLTALKRAGIPIVPELHPESLDHMRLDGAGAALLAWTHAAVSEKEHPLGQPILNVSHVNFHYEPDRPILEDVRFSVRKGERIALVGKNGAGKSTLTKLICGLEHPDSGTIYIGGGDISTQTIKERSEHIGLVMQNPNQMISQNMIFDEVAFGMRLRGSAEEEIKRRVYESLKICGLYPYRNWPVSALSFGQKKRVTIASILVLDPDLLILDEPTAGQDYRHYTEIMRFLESLSEKGMTLIMITHDMHLMLEYTERALVMADGRLIADQPPAELLSDADIASRANLKTTSLYHLAERVGFSSPPTFVKHFIQSEQGRRSCDENAHAQLH
ncbi:ABC transporter ATP-binding protein [Sporolactobacillus nakayamae]|uniref:Energy-coupling factor transport system ATP-binding protein n=1 Tax=Sporolactobacillus nakayamae TaxID=269670 RepID=A0A1I2QXH2_9BACL|nr:ABC transporter ATP-binding protein [Sporolactobacillus nakayamae]SFG31959.1 energy-coupling factor transport system ATP-binding protein [Sporolactobacillus nakayamae]